MAEIINWSIVAQVVGGPKISIARAKDVEAYDKLRVVVPAKVGTTAGTATVEV